MVRRPVPVVAPALGHLQEAAELVGGPHSHLRPLLGAELGRVGEGSDVADDDALALGVGERLVPHRVDVADGLDVGPTALALLALALLQQPGVEDVEVVGLQFAQQDLADRRHDMQFDVAPV